MVENGNGLDAYSYKRRSSPHRISQENSIPGPESSPAEVMAYLLDKKVYGPNRNFKNFRKPKLILR